MKKLMAIILGLVLMNFSAFTQDSPDKPLGMRKVVKMSVNEAVEKVKEKLNTEGFGVVLEMNVQNIMKKKIGKKMKPYVILGACNPPLAYQSILAEKEVGLFLPCNIIVYENSLGETVVSVVNPEEAMAGIGNKNLRPIASKVKQKLQKVLQQILTE